MPKKRQVNQGRVAARQAANKRKGKRLTGLTKQEATQRTKKGWRTRYAHGYQRRRAFAEEDIPRDPKNERHPLDEEASVNYGKAENWRERMAWEAKEFTQVGEFKDKEFLDLLSKADPIERDRLKARIQDLRRRQKQQDLRESDLKEEEKSSYVQDDLTIKRITSGYIGLINPNPEKVGERPGAVRRRADERLNELYTVVDPLIGQAPTVRDTERQVKILTAEQHKALVYYTMLSHQATTPGARRAAQVRAHRLLNQTAQQAQRVLDKRQAAQEALDLDQTPPLASPKQQKIDALHFEISDLQQELKDAQTEQERKRLNAQITTRAQQVRALAGERAASPLRSSTKAQRRRATVEQKRLGGQPDRALTVEDLYRASGHETAAPRLSWEARRLAARATGSQFDVTKPRFFHSIRKQAQFNKQQLAQKKDAWSEGLLNIGFKDKGERVPMDKATFGIRPNKEWHVTVRDENKRDRTITKRLAYWDTKTEVKPGDFVNDKLVDKFHSNVGIEWGERKAPRREEAPDWVEKEVFVPVPGLKTPITRHVKTGTENLEKFQIRHSWVEPSVGSANRAGDGGEPRVTSLVPSGAITQRDARWRDATTYISPETKAKMIKEGTGRTVAFRKQTRVHYVPPEQLKLGRKEQDTLNVRIPGTKQYGFVRAGSENKWRQVALAPALARQRRREEERAIRASQLPNRADRMQTLMGDYGLTPEQTQQIIQEEFIRKEGVTDEGHLKELTAAGTLAVAYGARRQIKEGYLPRAFNNSIGHLRGMHPKFDKLATKKGVPEAILDVEEAYVQPGVQRLANLRFKLRHPTKSPAGSSMGLEYQKWRNRRHWINPDKREARVLERTGQRITSLENTKEFVRNAEGRGGLTGRFMRWRAEPMHRVHAYEEFAGSAESTVGRAARQAREVLQAETLPVQKERTLRSGRTVRVPSSWTTVPQVSVRDVLDPKTGNATTIVVTPRQQKAAASLLRTSRRSAETEHWRQRHPMSPPITGPGRLDRWVGGDFTRGEKGLAIGAGVAATALGSAYIYHRYKQRNLPEDQKTKFYNVALPPSFGVPLPHARVTSFYRLPSNTVTNEARLAGRKVPLTFGIGLKDKRVTLRPVERGYPANAPIVGRLKVRGQKGLARGSYRDSLFFDQQATGIRKRSYRRPGGTLVVGGKALPIRATIGKSSKVQLKGTNPRRLTQEDRESLVWAYKNTPDEERIRNFYSFGKTDKVIDIFDDDEAYRKINKKKMTKDEKAFTKAAQVEHHSSYIDRGDEKQPNRDVFTTSVSDPRPRRYNVTIHPDMIEAGDPSISKRKLPRPRHMDT